MTQHYPAVPRPIIPLMTLPQIPGNTLTKQSVLSSADDGYQLVITNTEGDKETVATINFNNDDLKHFISEGR